MQNSEVLKKFMFTFCMSFIVSIGGMLLGQFVPRSLIIPLIIVEIVLIIVICFIKNKRFSYMILYLFMLISGMTLNVSISHYVSVLGADIVLKAFIVTAIVYIAIAIFGSITKFNLSALGNILFMGLLVLLIVSLVSFFITFSSTLYLIITIFSIVIFAGYTLYDFNQIARGGISEKDIPLMVIGVYLDFINLFQNVLRLVDIFDRD